MTSYFFCDYLDGKIDSIPKIKMLVAPNYLNTCKKAITCTGIDTSKVSFRETFIMIWPLGLFVSIRLDDDVLYDYMMRFEPVIGIASKGRSVTVYCIISIKSSSCTFLLVIKSILT